MNNKLLAFIFTMLLSSPMLLWSSNSNYGLNPVRPWPTSLSNVKLFNDFEKDGTSGVVFDKMLGKIFLVDDGGRVARSNASSSYPYYSRKIAGDLEAITIDDFGFVYVGRERTSCDPRGCNGAPEVEQFFKSLVSTGLKWRLVMPSGQNTGMEGLTWVPQGMHPYGNIVANSGVFYASSQNNGTIYVYNLNVGNASVNYSIPPIAHFTPDPSNKDISDLYFDVDQQLLYVLYDHVDKVLLIDTSTPSHNIIRAFQLPLPPIMKEQEGITVLPSCSIGMNKTKIYLAEDTNNYVSIFSNFPVFCPDNRNNSTFVYQSIDSKKFTSGNRTVSVTLKNTGNTIWVGYQYKLVVYEPASDNWGIHNILLKNNVLPGQSKTFSISAPPPINGDYNFQWRMSDGYEGFGDKTELVKIHSNQHYFIPPPPGGFIP